MEWSWHVDIIFKMFVAPFFQKELFENVYVLWISTTIKKL